MENPVPVKTLDTSHEALFREGTKLSIVPYEKNDIIEHFLRSNTESPLDKFMKNYYEYLDKYYNGTDSDLLRLLMNANFSGIKEPVLLQELFDGEENFNL